MNFPLEALDNASAPDRHSYRPEFFRLNSPHDVGRLVELLKRAPHTVVHDDLHSQLTELVRTLNPSLKFTKAELDEAAKAHLKGEASRTYGVWVHYPWNNRLVHLLDEEEFALVRTDRNRNKITREEQAVLATKKVGVIGLSVGQSVSLTMALERSFGELRIADFDTLELSNLNRIRSGTHEMGQLKTVNVAREIAELDPFLKVTLFSEGLAKGTIDAFCTEGGQLDILVDECDSVDVKILARQRAKELGIPVVMDMSDRGCLDVERFDLEPDRPILHGWIDHLDLEAAARPMTNEEKIPFMLPIVGASTLSPRMKASMVEMGQTLSTWPQLATSVVLGGALAGDVCRRILLDQFHGSGRWYVDLEALIADPKTNAPITRPSLGPKEPLKPTAPRRGLATPSLKMTQAQARALAEAGAFAPSAGNMQPWSFHHIDGRLLVQHDMVRSIARWDPDHLLAHIALGACLENILLKGLALGIPLNWSCKDPIDGTPLSIEIEVGSEKVDAAETEYLNELTKRIGPRCTNRKVTERVPLQRDVLHALVAVGKTLDGCLLHTFEGQDELDVLASCCSGAERIRLMDEAGHREFFEHELRWSTEEAHRTADGLDIATMELSPSDAAALQIIADPKAIELVARWGGGKGLERFSNKAIRSSSAVVLVSIPDGSVASRIQGGRSAQRVWLEADRLGLSVHPISAPLFMSHAARYMDDLNSEARHELMANETRLRALFNIDGRVPLFMMRLSLAGQPSTRSVRRTLDLQFHTSENTHV